MSSGDLYKQQLLDHFKKPYNKVKGPLEGATFTMRGNNPKCGDDIEVAAYVVDGVIEKVNYRVRGCSICIAASSMMAKTVEGLPVTDIDNLHDDIKQWLEGDERNLPFTLLPLSSVRDHPARKQCVMLPWGALKGGIDDYE
ncbi:MAG: iron-sulfur cluster assembly scaffold protein [Kangiellaceae bacterium]|jgi:nitrogen fixation NifU-like protein|nr:iron-sulfur cluster assembly scaffold protein [Kangiellaceae bacterium]